MHLFEFALKDFINLAKISSKKSLFLFHDVLPWTYEMATRDYKSVPIGEAWTGDIWKLIPILMDIGMEDNIRVITSAPSGLLAIFNPDKKIVSNLENNFKSICAKWIKVQLDKKQLMNLYQYKVFEKPESYLKFLNSIHFGKELNSTRQDWASH